MMAASAAAPVDREPGGRSPLAGLARPMLAESAGPAPVRLLPPWILIADDDPVVVEVWAAALRRTGFRTVAAREGGEAFDLMRSVLPDLMILDLRMPGLGGDGVLQRVRLTPALSQTPVLIISGFLDEEPVSDHGLNIVGRLPKPQSLEAVVQAVRAALARRPPA